MVDGEIYKRVLKLVRETAAGIEDNNGGVPLVLLGEDGLFDSVTALELVLAIEREFQIVIKDDDVTPENLGSIESLVQFIRARLEQVRGLALVFQPLAYLSLMSALALNG